MKTVNELITKLNQLDRPPKMSNKLADKKDYVNNNTDEKSLIIYLVDTAKRSGSQSATILKHCQTKLNPLSGKTYTINNKSTNVDKNFKLTNNTEIEKVLNQENVPKN